MFTKVITDEVVAQYAPMVHRIGREFSSKFRTVDREDITQEMWMWFVTHPGKTREWMDMPLKDGDKMFAKSLRNAAMSYCVKEKARIEGYHVDDLFWYSKDFIKELLPAVLSEDWKRVETSFDQSGSSGGSKPKNESGDWMVYATDIRKAYDSLSDDDRKLVDMFYVDDVHGSVLMEATERPTIRAAEMAANRAVGKMVKFLGGERVRLTPEPDLRLNEEPVEENQEEMDESYD